MSQVKNVAVLVGSLRKESINRKIALALADLAPSSIKLEIVEIGDLPLYSEDIDVTWLNTISSFGSQRGNVAHQSARAQSPLNPLDIKNNIALILQEIEVLDKMIKKLK